MCSVRAVNYGTKTGRDVCTARFCFELAKILFQEQGLDSPD